MGIVDIQKSRFFNKLCELDKALLLYDKIRVHNKSSYDLLNWFIEVTKKNNIIYSKKQLGEDKDQETFKKYRQHVYWINFGINIGTEFDDYHYAVVIKESKYTAVVVPLTSKKDKIPKWVLEDDAIVDLGLVKGYPSIDKECYACISLIQCVSKKRLDRCGNKNDGYFDIEITNKQMDEIDNMIKNKLTKSIDIPIKV